MPILFIVILFFILFLLNSPKVKGYFGELGVRIILKRLNKEEFEVLHNIMLMIDGKTTQIDHIIVARSGVFVVETKNYKGWIFGSEHSKYWTQTIYKSKQRFQNPIHQNFGHIKYLEHFLPDYSGPFFSIISFSMRGTLKKIDVESEAIHVIHSVQIPTVIKSKTVFGMSSNSVRRVVEMIREADVKDKRIAKKHVQTIKLKQQIKVEKVLQGLCPKCGNELQERRSKYGVFNGCSQYPKCRYTN